MLAKGQKKCFPADKTACQKACYGKPKAVDDMRQAQVMDSIRNRAVKWFTTIRFTTDTYSKVFPLSTDGGLPFFGAAFKNDNGGCIVVGDSFSTANITAATFTVHT